MPRLTPVHWEVLECIFLKHGFAYERQKGSHKSNVKSGVLRPLIIPTYQEVDTGIIRGLMRTAGMDRKTYFEFLEKCKKHK